MNIDSSISKNNYPNYIKYYTKKGEKSGGATDSGTHGGIYELEHNGTQSTILFKQGREDGEVIAEYVASRLYTLTTDKAANCFLAKWDQNTDTTEKNKQGLSSNVYIGSVFFKNFTDLFKEAGLSERARFARLKHADKVSNIIHRVRADESHNYGFEDIIAATLWQENRDIHWGNLGVTRDKSGNIDSVVALDFGWAFHNIQDEISLFGNSKYLVPGKPTNHFWDYGVDDRKLYISKHFTDALDKIVAIPAKEIKQNIKESLKEVSKFYDEKGLQNFAKRIGMPLEEGKQTIPDQISKYLSDKMINRQNAIKNLSTQIKLDLAISKDEQGKYNFDKDKIKQLVLENPGFFTNQNFKFRKLEHKPDAKFLTQAIKSIIESKEGVAYYTDDQHVQNIFSDFINKVMEAFSNIQSMLLSRKRNNTDNTQEVPIKKQKIEQKNKTSAKEVIYSNQSLKKLLAEEAKEVYNTKLNKKTAKYLEDIQSQEQDSYKRNNTDNTQEVPIK
ncbi:MAG: hypothetical protein AB8U66_01025, partial [Rickettsiales endosymbiont of Dermacentor nuttalli]